MDQFIVKSNPKSGLYTIRYKDSKGRFTKSLSKAYSFYISLEDGSLSRSFKFPKETKKVEERKFYIKTVLLELYKAEYDRKRKAQIKREEKARREGKKYRPKELTQLEEAVGISAKDRKRFDSMGVKTKPTGILYRLNKRDFDKRRKKIKKFSEIVAEDRQLLVPLPKVIASTKGSPTPTDREGNLLKDKKGKEIDWYRHQMSVGLITDKENDESIMYTIIRVLTKLIKTDFKKYLDYAVENKTRAKYLTIRVGVITDIEDHEDIYFSESVLQALVKNEWRYVKKIDGRKKEIIYTDDSFEALKGNDVLNKARKIFPNMKFKMSEDDEYQFQVPMKIPIKKMADSISFRSATNILKMINKDIETNQEREGGLTSSEIFTKIKLNIDNKVKNEKIQTFQMFPFITIELTQYKKEKQK